MRLAFVDLLFSWPPHGGACTDVYHTILELRRLGHEITLFCAVVDGMWERGGFVGEEPPFPVVPVEFRQEEFTAQLVGERFRRAVDGWKPEAVVVADGFFLKPYLMEALGDYPQAVRYYAYEFACPRDFRRYLHNAPCPENYLRSPGSCLRCAVRTMGRSLRRGRWPAFEQEFVAAKAHKQAYYDLARRTLKRARAVLVYNPLQAELLAPWTEKVHVVPGGVAVEPPFDDDNGIAAEDTKTILMVGRCEDPTKGFATLLRAGHLLAARRSDFTIAATAAPDAEAASWYRGLGWLHHGAVREAWRDAAIGVVPSIWDEPFGMVAVEAMAQKTPVVASRCGGLGDIVVDGETGFQVSPGDAHELAEKLAQLLDDGALRRRMGIAASRRVVERYQWPAVVRRHYPPILEALSE